MLRFFLKKLYRYKIGKTLSISTLVLIFLCLSAYFEPAKGDNKNTAGNDCLKTYWNNVCYVFVNTFGTTDLKIKSDKVINYEVFEIFLSKLHGRTNSRFIKKNSSIEQLYLLPKPLILKGKVTDRPIVLLNVFPSKQALIYQVLFSGNSPVLFSQKDLEKLWSGGVGCIENPDSVEIIHESGDLSLQIDKLSHNFGIVEPSTNVQTSIRIKNLSEVPLEIKTIRSSCVCTITTGDGKDFLQPGDETERNISISIGKGNKGFRYLVFMTFEDKANGKTSGLKFEFMGNCIDNSPVISPEKLEFTNIKANANKEYEQIVSITETSQNDLGNVRVSSSHPAIAAEKTTNETELSDGCNIYFIKVKVKSNMILAGKSYDEFVEIKTENPKYENLKIPVHIEAAPLVKAAPSLVAWGMPKIGQRLSRTVNLSSPYGYELEVSKIIAPDDTEVTIKQVCKKLRLAISKTFTNKGGQKEEVKIIFAKPNNTEVIIPMYALVVE